MWWSGRGTAGAAAGSRSLALCFAEHDVATPQRARHQRPSRGVLLRVAPRGCCFRLLLRRLRR